MTSRTVFRARAEPLFIETASTCFTLVPDLAWEAALSDHESVHDADDIMAAYAGIESGRVMDDEGLRKEMATYTVMLEEAGC